MPLQLHALGAPCASYNGQWIAFRSRRALALLIYLAVEPGFHTRDHLAALLWPDAGQAHSRMLLRSAIALLRQALSIAGCDATGALVLEQDRVLLDPAAVEIDLTALERAEQPLECEAAAGRGVEMGQLGRLQAAMRAYRGDFLRGFSLGDAPQFEDWASVQREHHHQRMHPIFARLVALLHARGEEQQALQAATRWIAHDPLHEAAHEQLIRLALHAGDRAGALSAYQRYHALLDTELGIAPNAAMRALIESLHVPVAAPIVAGSPAREERPAQRAIDDGTVWQSVSQAYRSARQRGAQALVLERPANAPQQRDGQLARWAEAEGADLIAGEAYNLSGRVPYQVIGDALRRRIDRERAPDDLLPDVWLAEISRLVPDLRDRYPDLPAPINDPATSAVRLYEAVANLTRAISQRRPVVVWIGNAHWADDASLDLLHYITRRWAEDGVPALLIYAVAADAAGRHTPHAVGLTQRLAQLGREVPVTFVSSRARLMERAGQSIRVLAA